MKVKEDIVNMLFKAYFDASQHKRGKHSQLAFEWQLEHNIFELYDELVSKTYRPGQSICFIVKHPVKREIFAANFRDRVVHHFIFNILNPLIEKELLHDVYSCRIGKGTLYGIQRAQSKMQSCSENYSQNAYVLKLDISGYFMNMNKNLLYQKVERIIDKNELFLPIQSCWLKQLVYQNIFHDPTTDCKFQSFPDEWKDLPKNKSLFYTTPQCGLPIGNLTSQLYGNLYLNDFDHFVKRDLNIKYYGRYVDDFYLLHRCKSVLLETITHIRSRLSAVEMLTLHPHKVYLQHISNGFAFLGVFIKPYCRYIGRRIKSGLFHALDELLYCTDLVQFRTCQSRIQSYRSMLQHHSCYKYYQSILAIEEYILSKSVNLCIV